MEAAEWVLPAARAVLDLLEREWQPLSPGELELRLDQAVEETLEAKLVSGLQSWPPPAAGVQEVPQNREAVLARAPPALGSPGLSVEGTPEAQEGQTDVDSAAVQVPIRDSSHPEYHRMMFPRFLVNNIYNTRKRENVYKKFI